MADEITIAAYLVGTSGGSTVASSPTNTTFKVNQTGTNKVGQTQDIGTSDEVLDFGDVTAGSNSLGWYMVENLDSTNYVELSLASGGSFAASAFAKIPAGTTFGPCYTTTDTVYAKANTAACSIFLTAFQQ